MTHDHRPLTEDDAFPCGSASVPEPASMSAVLGAMGAALCLIAIVWATYAAFDREMFDVQDTVRRAVRDVRTEVVAIACTPQASGTVR